MTLEQLGILTGIGSAILTGLYFIYKGYRDKRNKIREKITGQWGNEGDIVWSEHETHFVELVLTIDKEDGEITGTIKSKHTQEDITSPYCSVHGKLRFRSGELKILHVRHGELLPYGTVRIKFKRKILYWNLKNGVGDFFPKTTKLHRQNTPSFP